MIAYDIELERYDFTQGIIKEKIEVDNGAVLVQKFDETLDTGILTIPISSRKEAYNRLDTITITIGEGVGEHKFYYLISEDDVTIVSKYPVLYQHNIHLIERTKKLERFLSSTLTFTQPTDGSVRYTVLDALKRVRDTTPFEKTSLVSTTRIFNIPSSLDPLDDIELPQLFLTQNTVREMLNSIGRVINAIPRLSEDNNLSFDYFNYLRDLLVEQETISYSSTQDIEFYGTSIESYTRNAVMEDNQDQAKTYSPSRVEYVHLQSDTILETTDTAYFKTDFPIYQILKISYPISYTYQKTGSDPITSIFDVDITDFVFESKRYTLLTDEFSNKQFKITRRNALEYTLGKNKIQHAFKSYADLAGNVHAVWYEVIDGGRSKFFEEAKTKDYYDIFGNLFEAGGVLSYDIMPKLFQNALIKVEYTPDVNSRIRVEKDDITTINKETQISSNQQDRIISLDYYLKNLKGQVKRIGNEDLSLTNNITNVGDLIEIGDYFKIENSPSYYVCIIAEYSLHNDYITQRLEFSKNFNRISEFIGLNNEIRQYEIPTEETTYERNVIYDEYIELDITARNNTAITTTVGERCFMNTLKYSSGYDRPVTSGRFVPIKTSPPTLFFPTTANGDVNVLIFTSAFSSNQLAGYQLEQISTKWTQQPVRYTQDDGTLDEFKFAFGYDLPMVLPLTYETLLSNTKHHPITDDFDGVEKCIQSPNMWLQKDPSEILKLTYNLHIVPNIDQFGKIIVGRYLARNNNLVNVYGETHPVKSGLSFFVSGDSYGQFDNEKVKGTVSSNTFTIQETGQGGYYVVVTHTSDNLNQYKSWAIGDASGKSYLAVNQDENPLGGYIPKDTIYFNFLNKRRGIILGSKY